MRQFDLFHNPSRAMRGDVPYVAVLSSHLFMDLSEAIVAPVVRPGILQPSAVDIRVDVHGQEHMLSLIGLAAVKQVMLKKHAGSLTNQEYEIRWALDRLFTGF